MSGEHKRSNDDAVQGSGDSVERVEGKLRADEPEIDESTINELLAQADPQSRKDLDETVADGGFEETWNFDAAEELLPPEDIFSSDDLKGRG